MKFTRFILIMLCSCVSASLFAETWFRKFEILKPTPRKPAKTAILIISPSEEQLKDCSYANVKGLIGPELTNYWLLGRKVWKKYMNSHPKVDCFFVEPDTTPGEPATWIEGNTIHVRDPLFQRVKDGILHKTIAALEMLLPSYTHFIRTNLNMVFDLNIVNDYMETHHQSMYTGSAVLSDIFIGYGIIFTQDVANHIVQQYRLHEGKPLVSPSKADDVVLCRLATGMQTNSSYNKKFTCHSSLKRRTAQFMCDKNTFNQRLERTYITEHLFRRPSKTSLEGAKNLCNNLNTIMMYRVNRFCFQQDLVKIADFYQYLLQKVYSIDSEECLTQFAKNLLNK